MVELYDEPCDAIVFLQTIEHVRNPGEILERFKTLVGPGGIAFVSTPNVLTLAPPGAERSGNPWHVHEYRPEEFAALCRAHFPSVELYGLYHARKLALHGAALKLGWDEVHRGLGVTQPFYDRFTPAIGVRDFKLRRGAGARARGRAGPRRRAARVMPAPRGGELAIVLHSHMPYIDGLRDVAVRRGVAVGGDRDVLPAAARPARRRRAADAVADAGPVRPARGAGRARALRGVPRRHPRRVAPPRHRDRARGGRRRRRRRARALGGAVRAGARAAARASTCSRRSAATSPGRRRRRTPSCRCSPRTPACACSCARASTRTAAASEPAGAAGCGCRSARTSRGSTACSCRPACTRCASTSRTSSTPTRTCARCARPPDRCSCRSTARRSSSCGRAAAIRPTRRTATTTRSRGTATARGATTARRTTRRARPTRRAATRRTSSRARASGSPAAGSPSARSTPSCSATGGTRARCGSPRCSTRRRARACAIARLDDALARHDAGAGAGRAAGRRRGARRATCATWSAPPVAGHGVERARRRAAHGRGGGAGADARAVRELLALQSSDWAFLVARDLAEPYGRERAAGHRAALAEALARPGTLDPRVRNLAPDASPAALLEP